MKKYDRRILNSLLDSYERSLLFTGKNKVEVRISFPFSAKSLPEYFDESSTAYEDIHACAAELEQRGFVEPVWKKGKAGHIIEKVLLVEAAVGDIYAYLGRTPKAQLLQQNLNLLTDLQNQYGTANASITPITPITAAFIEAMEQRIHDGKSVKEYVDLSDLPGTRRLIEAIAAVETNEDECYIREFSIRHFSDSKALENMLGAVTKVMRDFNPRFEGWAPFDVLAEYSIYHTPNYVYFKGQGRLCFGQEIIDLKAFAHGIGVSGQDLRRMKLAETENVKTVLTIENLTTFFRWQEDGCMIIYLGGYLNSVRRAFLKELYRQLPGASYLHFGDIDVGGFEIYEDLRRKTGIPFKPYYMDLETLRKYEAYTRPLTQNDRRRLGNLRKKNADAPYLNVLDYMLEKGIKLEQEGVG
ncbi:DUF2220 domain-containing protein [Anaerovorax odorimutans]|uniref:DUF2220 domain-containing protein n=1 Tax=Anaerovorax odorimutans TaxID=109327 RepID=A0ABT1RLQ2_9FIRM|nr:Wadjet anti-phage system protein JetD domain-containing protein [Anaerovorax odorimutans]MCQ4636098.1 DUF2220 domain-containing protein [Anaerovorax odorimutans]